MSLFRIAFLLISVSAIAGTTYVSYQGYGRESLDLDRSVRTGGYGAGRIK